MNRKFDYIIAGQGIAGTVLTRTLLRRGKTVLLIDHPGKSHASRIAAGLYNPVVFKRLVQSWMADELIAAMDAFYPSEEKEFSASFYFKKAIVKIFTEENEKALWLKKQHEEVGKYLSPEIKEEFLPGLLMPSLGAAEVINAGHLLCNSYLEHARASFKSAGILLEEAVDHALISFPEGRVEYKGFSAQKLIFCEGSECVHNPFFSWLPFKLTKGELLIVKIPALGNLEQVINKGVFILPLGNDLYKVGATYEWTDLSEEITEKGRAELIRKLEQVIRVPFEVLDQQAGVRPTVSDRRPLIGLHPKHPALGVFNGLGTKGIMLAPYFAAQFAAFLEEGGALHPEVDISRFK